MVGGRGTDADERAGGEGVDEDGVDTGDDGGRDEPRDGWGTEESWWDDLVPIIRPANNSSTHCLLWYRTFSSRSPAKRSFRFPSQSALHPPSPNPLPRQRARGTTDPSDPAEIIDGICPKAANGPHLTGATIVSSVLSLSVAEPSLHFSGSDHLHRSSDCPSPVWLYPARRMFCLDAHRFVSMLALSSPPEIVPSSGVSPSRLGVCCQNRLSAVHVGASAAPPPYASGLAAQSAECAPCPTSACWMHQRANVRWNF